MWHKKGPWNSNTKYSPFNPLFPFATSHTVSTRTRECNIRSPVTEHIESNFPRKKQTKNKIKEPKNHNYTKSTKFPDLVFVEEVSELSMRRDMQWDRWKEKHSVDNSACRRLLIFTVRVRKVHTTHWSCK